MLAPLFVFVRADYSLSYTDLAVALTACNVVSATFQTPVGFLVDRVGARIVLSAGVALGAAAFAVAAWSIHLPRSRFTARPTRSPIWR